MYAVLARYGRVLKSDILWEFSGIRINLIVRESYTRLLDIISIET